MRRLLVVIGIALVIAGLYIWAKPYVQDLQSQPLMPSLPVAASSSPSSTPSATSPSPTAVSVVPAPIAALPLQPTEDATPTWLSIPSIGVDESVLPQGLNAAQELEPSPNQTVWYTGSPKPGRPGISVIAGHVSWKEVPDNFWRLRELLPGATFVVTYSDGVVLNFVVEYAKSASKAATQEDLAVWGSSAEPVQVLITCDNDPTIPKSGHNNRNNWIVFARLA